MRKIVVRKRPGFISQGWLTAGHRILPCALGRSGLGIKRREGDGITPIGTFGLLETRIRADRFAAANVQLPASAIAPGDGWCDAAGERDYNRPVQLPYSKSHECLWRDDHLYDCLIVMDFNILRHMRVGGSAIFFHLAHDDYRATEGCVAISRPHMQWLLPQIGPQTVMQIG